MWPRSPSTPAAPRPGPRRAGGGGRGGGGGGRGGPGGGCGARRSRAAGGCGAGGGCGGWAGGGGGRERWGWAVEHDTALALRLAGALGWWWFVRGRLAGEYRLVCQAAGRAEAGSGGWRAAQIWLGWAARSSADLAAALGHFTAVRDAVSGR